MKAILGALVLALVFYVLVDFVQDYRYRQRYDKALSACIKATAAQNATLTDNTGVDPYASCTAG